MIPPIWGLVDKPDHWTNPSYLTDFIKMTLSPRRIETAKLVDLYVKKGLSASQIAEQIGSSKQMVLSRLRRTGIRNSPNKGRSPDNYRFRNPPYGDVGREIVEEEQKGANKAGYGEQLLEGLAERLTREFGKGFTQRNLRYMRAFYLAFPIRHAVRAELSWTHYRLLSNIDKTEARAFYQSECIRARWSTRELERQVNSLLFERLALSKNKAGVQTLTQQGHEVFQASDLIKDPYVLEFTGLPEDPRHQESDLEQALMNHLQKFLLELGKDIHFVARQKRITINGDHFYIDLVFYHRLLRCFVLIDLKVGRLTQQDIGQMLLYTGYYEAENMAEGENPPVGLILCADKNEAVVRYTLNNSNRKIFASRYKTYLPTEEELIAELRKERGQIELESRLKGKTSNE